MADASAIGHRSLRDRNMLSTIPVGQVRNPHMLCECEMEREVIDQFDSNRIDRIQQAHAQHHSTDSRPN